MKYLVIHDITSYGGPEPQEAYLLEAKNKKEAIIRVGKKVLPDYFKNSKLVKEGFCELGWAYDQDGLFTSEVKEDTVTIRVEDLLSMLGVSQVDLEVTK